MNIQTQEPSTATKPWPGNERMSVVRLQRCQRALSKLIAAGHDARQGVAGSQKVSLRGLGGLSRYIKELLAVHAKHDITACEVQLKRRLVRVQHRLHGYVRPAEGGTQQGGTVAYSLASQLPAVHQKTVERYDERARELLDALAHVDLAGNHQHLVSAAQTLGLAPARPQSADKRQAA